MKYIDIENWKRKHHFELFNSMTYPHFNICTEVDVTETYKYIKKQGKSIFAAILYQVSRVANEIEEFRLRIREDKVVLHDEILPSFTVLGEDELFYFATINYIEDSDLFFKKVREGINNTKSNPSLEDEPRDDYIYITSLPWIKFTSISHPINTPADSIPRIGWGKIEEKDGRYLMSISVQAHHALADGVHISQYIQKLQENFDMPGDFFS